VECRSAAREEEEDKGAAVSSTGHLCTLHHLLRLADQIGKHLAHRIDSAHGDDGDSPLRASRFTVTIYSWVN